MTILRTRGLSKQYPGVLALDGVDFDLRRGEVHVLFGENGAGKSTLISLLAGASTPTAGSIELNGSVVRLRSVREARLQGISAVFQELSLVPTLSVAENLFLGEEPHRGLLLDRAAMIRGAERVLAELQFDIDCRRTVARLSRAEQQMVEIAKGMRTQASVLILDEPTASLTDKETLRLFELVRRLKAQDVGIIYISHRMQEIDEIADRITVLRDGRKIDTVSADGLSHDRLIEMMTGRAVEKIYPHIEARPGETVLQVTQLSTASGVRQASITVRRGEIVGLAGLVGSASPSYCAPSTGWSESPGVGSRSWARTLQAQARRGCCAGASSTCRRTARARGWCWASRPTTTSRCRSCSRAYAAASAC